MLKSWSRLVCWYYHIVLGQLRAMRAIQLRLHVHACPQVLWYQPPQKVFWIPSDMLWYHTFAYHTSFDTSYPLINVYMHIASICTYHFNAIFWDDKMFKANLQWRNAWSPVTELHTDIYHPTQHTMGTSSHVHSCSKTNDGQSNNNRPLLEGTFIIDDWWT